VRAIDPEARLALVMGSGKPEDRGSLTLWDVGTGKTRAKLGIPDRGVTTTAFSPDGRRLLTVLSDGEGLVWDTATGAEAYRLRPPTIPGELNKIVLDRATFTPDGKQILAVFNFHDPAAARVLDAATGEERLTLTRPRYRPPGRIQHHYVRFAVPSPDGRLLARNAISHDVGLWDVTAGGEPVAILKGHTDTVLSATFSADGGRLLTTSEDRTARVWDARSGEPVAVLAGHDDTVTAASFSPDGGLVVTASADRTARLWDARTGQELATLRLPNEPVEWAVFCGGGRHVFTRGDRTARLWPVDVLAAARARLPRELTAEERARFEVRPVDADGK
jgi:WD40 repeat protein